MDATTTVEQQQEQPSELQAMLAKWDAGEPIWTIELGGLGPGYEQAIQVAAVEMARAGAAFVPTGEAEVDNRAWDELCTDVLRKHDEALCGLSGAQYGAARWLAWQWCHRGGPGRLQERAKEHGGTSIMVSRTFPRAPEPA